MNPTIEYFVIILAPPAAWAVSRFSTWPWARMSIWGREPTEVRRVVESEIARWAFGFAYVIMVGLPLGPLSNWALVPAPLWTVLMVLHAWRRICAIRAVGEQR